MASKTNPVAFIKQVRAETAKVTWPTRRETFVSTMMVLFMAFIVSIFLFVADRIMEFGVWEVVKFFEHLFT